MGPDIDSKTTQEEVTVEVVEVETKETAATTTTKGIKQQQLLLDRQPHIHRSTGG